MIRTVGVVGAGQMGSGIAEVCAAGADVVLVDLDRAAVDAGLQRIRRSLDGAVRRGRVTEEEAAARLGRIAPATDVTALAGANLVIEAVVESLQVKQDLFGRLGDIVAPTAVLASNTSSLPIAAIGRGSTHPERVLGLHFFNPPPALDLVELTPTLVTDPALADAVQGFFTDGLGRTVIRSQDRAGFIVNALLVPYLLSAVRMLENGIATREDIDTGMQRGCGHPMGPLRLLDLIGLDTMVFVADGLYAEWRDPAASAPAMLRRMVDAGLLGRKSGRGFYDYTEH
ncbi:3-hydroxybutyryl-CoA dehydrogenase [Nakamurella sp. YIM 132087]|uniref:3-hydroxybutyryl-CoA dehydrogenase n=1 Tax=Nakamurella alba TaxID=2665158 RepID=A0A7K1FT14_9ACTN|nr:3-hydroxybutyryl-CoA dehydrogenase [Nakamurella alba]MTD17268.1 3-hydroxybutyryl-CoA dehydrogenase [Nakamurella alba]